MDRRSEEVRDPFGSFGRNDRRPRLYEKLEALVKDVAFADPGIAILLDGIFLMAGADEPGDIDVVLIPFDPPGDAGFRGRLAAVQVPCGGQVMRPAPELALT